MNAIQFFQWGSVKNQVDDKMDRKELVTIRVDARYKQVTASVIGINSINFNVLDPIVFSFGLNSHGYFDSLDDINNFFMMDFIDHIQRNLCLLKTEEKIDKSTEKFVLRDILAILLEVFDNTDVPSLGNILLIDFKAGIFNNIHFKNY